MKTSNPKYLLLIILIFFLLQSCKKDNNNTKCGGNKYYHYLSEPEKATVPYEVNDSIIFISNKNDTAFCICKEKVPFYVTSSFYANPDCPPNTDYYEAFNYIFFSNNANFKIGLYIYENDGYGLETIHIIYNQTDFPLYVERIDRKITADFIDSLQVGSIWYKNVSITGKYFNTKLDRLYYNKQFGILKIQNIDSTEIWELVSKN